MEQSMNEILRNAESLPKFHGYEVRRFTFEGYKPNGDWIPFAITHVSLGIGAGQDYIWCRREKWGN